MIGEIQATDASHPFLDLLEDPVFLQIVCLSIVALLVLWLILSIRSSLGKLQGRRLLVKYLGGLEASLAGDNEEAVTLLQAVVEADPENLGARLALGNAFFALERPADAHRHHMEAQQTFAAEGPRIQLSIVRDLRAAGEHADAVELVDEALDQHPKDEALLAEAFELKCEAGMFQDALIPGRRLFERNRDETFRGRLGATAARAGMLAIAHGERDEAARLFQESLGYDAENREAQTGRILASPEPDLAQLPAPAPGGAGTALLAESDVARISRSLLDFFPEAVCPRCRSPRSGESCATCGSEEPALYAESELERALRAPEEALDEIEENDAWFRRLAIAARSGDAEAAGRMLDGGAAALPSLLSVLLESGDQDGRLRDVCVGLGREHPDALFRARAAHRAGHRGVLDRLTGKADVDALLGPVFRRLGAPPRAHFDRLIRDSQALDERGLRGLVIDYYVGLADLAGFEELAARYSPVEVVRRLNKIPDSELAPLFSLLPEEASFLRSAILMDPALDRPAAIALALLRVDGDALVRWRTLLTERGPGAQMLAELVLQLGDPNPGANIEAMLGAFLADAQEHLVAGFADPDRNPAAKAALARLLHAAGPRIVPDVIRCFGSTPSELDARAMDLLVSFGDDAVPYLESEYREQVGWLGRLGASRFRPKHPRSQICRALARIEGSAARKALKRLLKEESDAELASLLRELVRTHGRKAR